VPSMGDVLGTFILYVVAISLGTVHCLLPCRILGFHSSEDSNHDLLSCDAMLCCSRRPTFQKTSLPSSSPKSKAPGPPCARDW
jgi:hypothetical protein